MQGVAHILEKAIYEASRSDETVPEDIIIGYSPAIMIHDIMTSQYMRGDSSAPITMDELDTMIEKIE
jgi:hypothetical protein